jgi:hypothetical protein
LKPRCSTISDTSSTKVVTSSLAIPVAHSRLKLKARAFSVCCKEDKVVTVVLADGAVKKTNQYQIHTMVLYHENTKN